MAKWGRQYLRLLLLLTVQQQHGEKLVLFRTVGKWYAMPGSNALTPNETDSVLGQVYTILDSLSSSSSGPLGPRRRPMLQLTIHAAASVVIHLIKIHLSTGSGATLRTVVKQQ
jgi:hypothetical protein